MTDIWKLPNGHYLRRTAAPGFDYLEFALDGFVVGWLKGLRADAVPMVPATGRQVTGQELSELVSNHDSWIDAAESLNLFVREPEPRQPWEVLREAADIVEKRWPPTEYSRARIEWLRGAATDFEADAKETSRREREIEAEATRIAAVLGDFAIADEHSGDRNDIQLGRLLASRGVRVLDDAAGDR